MIKLILSVKRPMLTLIFQRKLDESTSLGNMVIFFHCEDHVGLIALGLKPSTFLLGDSETVRVFPEVVTIFIHSAFALTK